MKSQYPNHFICLKQINKSQWTVVFRRNNLSKQLFNFDKENNCFSYEERFKHISGYISFKITIKSSVFYDIFCADCKYFKATGGNNAFGISIRTKKLPIDDIMYNTIYKEVHEYTEFVDYTCSFKGKFNIYQLFDKKWDKLDKTVIFNKNKKNKMKRKLKPKGQNQTIKEIPYERIEMPKTKIDVNTVQSCSYFRNKICIYFNNLCNPYSIRCKNPDILLRKNKTISHNINNQTNKIEQVKTLKSDKKTYVKTVILSYNKKCVYEEHTLKDIKAIIRVLTASNTIIEDSVCAAYCERCNQYIILKDDFKSIRQKGILLCRVIDRTPEHIKKHKNASYSGAESRIHSLGYNVIKQGYNYSFEQRKIILANIMQNYGITQHEILSMLDTNIARKVGLSKYEVAVKKWQQDREFVANYKLGDIPEVIIDDIIVGRR